MTSQPSYLPHLNPPSYRVLLLPAGPEEINEFSFKAFFLYRIPHLKNEREKWEFNEDHFLINDFMLGRATGWCKNAHQHPGLGYWVTRHFGTSYWLEEFWHADGLWRWAGACRRIQVKKEENISSTADNVQELSSGTKKNAEIILPRIICTSLRKSCPILLGGFSKRWKFRHP